MAISESKFSSKVVICLVLFIGTSTGANVAVPLNFMEIAHKAGLPCEDYEITTEDGYILDIFRIPGDVSRPVLLQSGAFGTADDYIILENTSLPAVLWRAGYDTWVGNVRGCRYGLRHETLDPDSDEFWDFSFHEYAVYDTPAMIDFVLNFTQQTQLSSIAWSLGTTSFYVLGSERPEYNDKVKVTISLAPIGYLHHCPVFEATAKSGPFFDLTSMLADKNSFFRSNSPELNMFRRVCTSPELAYDFCLPLLSFTYGFDLQQIPHDFAPVIYEHYPSSISRKALDHLEQILRNKRFAKYDFGPIENERLYGTLIPPEYNLRKNDMSVIMISGKNDFTSTLIDVELLKPKLSNVVDHIILVPEKFNHMDFAYGKDTYKVLYKPIVLRLLSDYN